MYEYLVLTYGILLCLHVKMTNALSLADMKCKIGPLVYPVGDFMNPDDACSICNCKDDGNYVCRSVCKKPECGKDLHRNDTNYPKSCNCKVCSTICQNINPPCEELTCNKWNYHYRPNECCAECRCLFEGKRYPRGPFGPKCDKCRCQKNWDVLCERPPCPTPKLECVDAKYDKDCNYICPNGRTCAQGPYVIKYGEFKRIGGNVCTCVGPDWYPRAFCAKRMWIGTNFKKLMKRRCVADPTTYTAWKMIAALYK